MKLKSTFKLFVTAAIIFLSTNVWAGTYTTPSGNVVPLYYTLVPAAKYESFCSSDDLVCVDVVFFEVNDTKTAQVYFYKLIEDRPGPIRCKMLVCET